MSLITITSGIGCNEMEIALRVADALKTDLYDDERLQKEFMDMGLSSAEMKSLDEKAPGIFNRLLDFHPQSYLELLEALIYEVSRRGEGIIIGHGAQFLLRDFGCALHIRIYSSTDRRIESIGNTHGVSPGAAEKMVRSSDNDRKGFMHYAFKMDWDNPSLYDLVVNVDKLGVEASSSLITNVAQSDIINACSLDALERMERFTLEKKVKTAVLKTSLSARNIHVDSPEPGSVVLTGTVNPLESKDALLDAVRAVPGVVNLKDELAMEKLHDI